MEIRHAVFEPLRDTDREGKPLLPAAHAFFYLRDASYLTALRQHSPHLESVYTDAEADKLRQLVALIRARPGAAVRDYVARWRHEGPFRTPELSVPLRCPATLEANRRLWREHWERAAGVVVPGEEITDPDDVRKADGRRRAQRRVHPGTPEWIGARRLLGFVRGGSAGMDGPWRPPAPGK